jgi:hypothetical protein
MSGDVAAATALLASVPSTSEDERQFREWFAHTFSTALPY